MHVCSSHFLSSTTQHILIRFARAIFTFARGLLYHREHPSWSDVSKYPRDCDQSGPETFLSMLENHNVKNSRYTRRGFRDQGDRATSSGVCQSRKPMTPNGSAFRVRIYTMPTTTKTTRRYIHSMEPIFNAFSVCSERVGGCFTLEAHAEYTRVAPSRRR